MHHPQTFPQFSRRVAPLLRATALAAGLAALLIACGGEEKPGGGGSTANEQTCAVDGDCDGGKKCIDSKCTLPFTGGDSASTFDAGPQPDAGGTADAAAKADTGSTTGGQTGGDCATCSADSDCAEGFACVPLLNSTDKNFCVKKCSAKSECTAGLLCQQATQAAQKFCIPPSFKCEGCAIDGCKGEGESCDFSAKPPACVKAGGTCATCQLTKDCGPNMVCVKQGNDKICAPSCASGEKCPSNSTCIDFSVGIKACSFTAEKCCFGDSCKASSACAGCPGKCVAGACVECLKDADCSGGSTCIASSHTCQKASCPSEKPIKLATGECVECSNDTHCSGSSVGPKCVANKCAKANQNNECAVCQDPYPGCVEINGAWSCVECATDADCAAKKKGSCSAKTFTCSGTTAGGGTVTPSTKCKADSDCKPGTSGFTLKCDVPTGTCYDVKGQCDNIVAFCNASKGSVCKPFDLLGLGGAGGGLPSIPGLPSSTPSSSGAGVCSCGTSGGSSGSGWDDSICKQFKLTKCDCAKDAKSKDCDPIGLGSCCQQSGGGGSPLSLLTCISQLTGSKPDPACFGGKSCSDMSCLTAATGGGGSSSGKGGYCADPQATP